MSNDFKWIERKSVTPIEPATGAVSDTLNVEDKITNAPSINLVTQMTGIPQEGIIAFEGDEIPEGYEEVVNPDNAVKKEDTSSYLEAGTGFTILGATIYRVGNSNKLFGNAVVKKDSGVFSGTQEIVLNLKIYNTYIKNTGCFLSSAGEWNTNGIGYCYVSPTSVQISDDADAGKYNIAKISLDLVERM